MEFTGQGSGHQGVNGIDSSGVWLWWVLREIPVHRCFFRRGGLYGASRNKIFDAIYHVENKPHHLRARISATTLHTATVVYTVDRAVD